ncbi:hypothetical protein Sjap_020604 [Stephania japonica]|uniref:Flap endonuclease GEN-like 2 n=1 Tax=Stephania japonica TaxID=461633 RepID=A0AAP0I0J9_9MAGN
MGVKNLWDILESCKKTLPLHHLQNKRVCIDLSCWMVQLQNASKPHSHSHSHSHSSFKDNKLYLSGFFHRLRALLALNCTLILVADGSIPAIKFSSYRRRLGLGSEVAQDERNLKTVLPLRRNKGSEFSCMIKEAKALGAALGIPCLDGIEEAEAQCALLNSEYLCDGCFTSDSDIFLFGGRTVYRDIHLGDGGYVICYEMVDIESKLGFGRNSLIALALILGSDYSQGVHGLGREAACQTVKSIGDATVLQQIASEGFAFARKSKGSKKQEVLARDANKENILVQKRNNNAANVHDQQEGDMFLEVINAYLKPECHSPDSESVHRVLAHYPFQRTKLQEICAQYFGWTAEKTDEYILPKIAERDLRRFANLRSSSSKLGLQVPLLEIPVTCPVSAIVKPRKIQGRECFEVSWKNVDSLKSSIVPADLIESACPEMIAVFEEKKAQERKCNRKPKAKKSDNGAATREVERRLQNLLLDIELESNATPSTAIFCKPVGCSNELEVIDLLSPSPSIRSREVFDLEKTIGKRIEVVDLCESETEASPEHARKMREVRMFIASMKGD